MCNRQRAVLSACNAGPTRRRYTLFNRTPGPLTCQPSIPTLLLLTKAPPRSCRPSGGVSRASCRRAHRAHAAVHRHHVGNIPAPLGRSVTAVGGGCDCVCVRTFCQARLRDGSSANGQHEATHTRSASRATRPQPRTFCTFYASMVRGGGCRRECAHCGGGTHVVHQAVKRTNSGNSTSGVE